MEATFGTILFLLVVSCMLALHYRSALKKANSEKINLYCKISDRDQEIVALQENSKKVYEQLCCLNFKIQNQAKFGIGDTIGKFMIIGEPVAEMAFPNELTRLIAIHCLSVFNPKYKAPQDFAEIIQSNPLCHYMYAVQTDILKKPFKICESQLIKLQINLNKQQNS